MMKTRKLKTQEEIDLELQKNPNMSLSEYVFLKTGWKNLLGSVSRELKTLVPIIEEYNNAIMKLQDSITNKKKETKFIIFNWTNSILTEL